MNTCEQHLLKELIQIGWLITNFEINTLIFLILKKKNDLSEKKILLLIYSLYYKIKTPCFNFVNMGCMHVRYTSNIDLLINWSIDQLHGEFSILNFRAIHTFNGRMQRNISPEAIQP